MNPNWKLNIAANLDEYNGFFESTWEKEISAVADGSKFQDATFILTLAFHGQSSAREMPMTMLNMLNEILTGLLIGQSNIPTVVVERYLDIVHENSTISKEDRRKAHLSIMQLYEHVNSNIKERIVPQNTGKLWEDLIKEPSFASSLYRSELNAYSGLYFAYEDYIRQGFALFQPDPGRIGTKILKQIFDEPTVEACWTDPRINAARLIRHAIAHVSSRRSKCLLTVSRLVRYTARAWQKKPKIPWTKSKAVRSRRPENILSLARLSCLRRLPGAFMAYGLGRAS